MPADSLTRSMLLLVLVSVVCAVWHIPMPDAPAFVVNTSRERAAPETATTAVSETAAPLAASDALSPQPEFVVMDLPRPTPSAHASSMVCMPDGSLNVAWFGGQQEGASDVAIHMARVERGGVTKQWVSLTRKRLQQLTHRVIRKLGNPVLHIDDAGVLHMYVVSVSYGGWSGSAVNHLQSHDGGASWDSARRFILSPFFNLSTLVRNQPIVVADGSIALPAYHEFIWKWGQWVRLTSRGTVVQFTRMTHGGTWLQPAVAAIDSTNALAVFRSGDPNTPSIGRTDTCDGGVAWAESASPTGIANPNSSVSMLRLTDGSLLLAANPTKSGRGVLQLFQSVDKGNTWTPSRTIQRSGGAAAEFSYPFLVQDLQGTVHLSYTYRRLGIRLCSFTTGWLKCDDTNTAATVDANVPMSTTHAVSPPAPIGSVWSTLRMPIVIGLLAQGVIVAAIIRWFRLMRGSAKPTPILLELLIPVVIVVAIPFDGVSIAAHMRGLWGDPSTVTLLLVLGFVLHPTSMPPRPSTTSCVALSLLVTVPLYAPLFLGTQILGTDLYAIGFRPWVLIGAIVICIVFMRRRLQNAWLYTISFGLMAYSTDMLESNNLWDYLVDPGLLLALAGFAIAGVLASLRPAVRHIPTLLALVISIFTVACKSQPNIGPGEWFNGESTLSGDATIFGSGGPTSVMWKLPATTTDWVWRVSTTAQTRELAIRNQYAHSSDDPMQGHVWWIGDSTGSWSGTISPDNPRDGYGRPATPPFTAFVIDGVPATGDGRVEGKGQLVSDELFLTLQWFKADGSVGAHYSLKALGQNEQEYLKALGAMHATPPPITEPIPQRSP